MLSAIELYNKPDFKYREETFAILSINAWELLLKAYILKTNGYKCRFIYEYEDKRKKSGEKSQQRQIAKNRMNNPKTISIFEAIKRLFDANILPETVKSNIELLIEFRDNAIHFVNLSPSMEKQIQELGFACIRNYIRIIKKWEISKKLDKYNFYLMPLAYIDETTLVEAESTKEEQNYTDFFLSRLKEQDNVKSSDFHITAAIDITFKKGQTNSLIGARFDPNGIPLTLTEEDIKSRFPWTHKEVMEKCKERYIDFKRDKDFNKHMKEIKSDLQLCHKRELYPGNPKTSVTYFYSTNIWKILDKYYTKEK